MESATKPLVSVVTPVYNGERHLAECIESVIAQTRTDWEYIIVDNCSQDRSAAIAERYAATDERIRVVRCDEFVNVHRNFSRGARLIDPDSRYCKFLAADDWMYPECLDRMVAVADRQPAVGIVSSYRLEGKRLGHDGLLPYTQEVMPGRQVVRAALLAREYVTGSPSQLLYRADLVRRVTPFLDETFWHSDSHAAFRTLLDSDLGFVHQVLTFTRLHPGALTSISRRFNTYLSNDIRFLIRFGAEVLTVQEYRSLMRSLLRQYGWYLLKKRLQLWRRADAGFHAFHRAEIAYMLAELGDDRETRTALQALRVLLAGSRSAEGPMPRAAGEEK